MVGLDNITFQKASQLLSAKVANNVTTDKPVKRLKKKSASDKHSKAKKTKLLENGVSKPKKKDLFSGKTSPKETLKNNSSFNVATHSEKTGEIIIPNLVFVNTCPDKKSKEAHTGTDQPNISSICDNSINNGNSSTVTECPTDSVPIMKFIEKFEKKRDKNVDNPLTACSMTLGQKAMKKILSPVCMKDFFSNYWEENCLLIKSNDEKRFDGILSTSDIDRILRLNNLQFSKNIDVTSYKDGKRTTFNPEGRAFASLVWDFYNSGCSVRMLNPQTFHKPVWKLLSILQEHFSSFCGANVYLTPPGTQGFAPHWDDIEAFILQLEGKKRWRVYKPRCSKETLPRFSSENFGPDTPLGKPVLDEVLKPGDVLYFPRGFIHQGEALDDTHSLHITLSTFQKNTWSDFLEKLLPAALAKATEEDESFRRGLPRSYLSYMGAANSECKKQNRRKHFETSVKELVTRLMDYAPLDAAVDQMGKGFIHDSLPPVLTLDEKKRSVFDGGERWNKERNNVIGSVELTPETCIRLTRKGCVRLVFEEDSIRLFHSLDNSREYHGEELKYIEIAPEIVPGVEALIQNYPSFIEVEKLPLSTLEEKIILAVGLWERGIVTTERHLKEEEANYEEMDDEED